MEIRQTSFNYDRLRGSGPRTSSSSIIFPRSVREATAALTGYSVGFRGEDHHIGNLRITLDTQINSNVVTVNSTFGLRDWSGNWDDDYAGTVLVTVFAELEDISAPPPRGDIAITGLEYNQAIQYFRSADHLDADHALPDNSIPLIGGKATGIRVYVDYDANSGLPVINSLSGELVIESGTTTFNLNPIMPIIPRRDASIERAQPGHTLNFMIPAAWCRGTIDIACRVFDATSPNSGSAIVRRTLTFLNVNPVRIYCVGIHYTGQSMNLPAPTETDMLNTLGMTRKLFPTGDVLLSGYTAMDFSDDLNTTDTTGCGDGFESLNGELKDLKGDSNDLIYGLLPNGITFGTFVGCGGDGVGSGTMGAQTTAAHEAGHAYGRKHAPCDNATRCNNPDNQDGEYPHYGIYASDSTGEFGYDPVLNMVFNPANSFDIMGYSSPRWISPYTYMHLMTPLDPVGGSGGINRAAYELRSPFQTPTRDPERWVEWQRKITNLMHLEIWVDRENIVTLKPAFTYPDYPINKPGAGTGYKVEIWNKYDKEISCAVLEQGCVLCGSDCYPKHLTGVVPFDSSNAHTLVLFQDGKKIHSVEIPPPPHVEFEDPEYKKDGSVILHWKYFGQQDQPYFLVHWQDEVGTWRGIAPRGRDNSLVISARYRRGRKELNVRLLATNGLSTSIVEIKLNGIKEYPYPRIILSDPNNSPVVNAWVLDHLGRSLSNAQLIWHDEDGREIFRGDEFDLRNISRQRKLLRVVALNTGAGKVETTLYVEGKSTVKSPPWRKPLKKLPGIDNWNLGTIQ